jgi:hypothetical protein
MRTSLPDNRQTGYVAGLKRRNPPRNPVSRTPRRSGRHLGEAERVIQTFLTYGLYQDRGRTQPWGWSSGDAVDGLGSGATRSIPVYGKINAGQSAVDVN